MPEAWAKKYRWIRTWPDDKGPDGKPPEDYSAYDGEAYAGRIRFITYGLKKSQWMWSGARPKSFRGEPIVPNAGYRPTAAEAAKTVEEYWDAMKAKQLASSALTMALIAPPTD